MAERGIDCADWTVQHVVASLCKPLSSVLTIPTAFSGLELLSSSCVRHMQGFGVVLHWYFKGLHCVC